MRISYWSSDVCSSDLALRANPALAAQSQNVRASDFDVDAARAQQYPQLSFNARYTHSDGGRTIDIPTGQLLHPVYDTLNRFLAERGEPPQFQHVPDQRIAPLRDREQETDRKRVVEGKSG